MSSRPPPQAPAKSAHYRNSFTDIVLFAAIAAVVVLSVGF